jgi:hypothetical protein
MDWPSPVPRHGVGKLEWLHRPRCFSLGAHHEANRENLSPSTQKKLDLPLFTHCNGSYDGMSLKSVSKLYHPVRSAI